MKRSLPGMLEEESRARPARTDPEAGFGALRTERGCLPLEALDVRARIDGLVAQVHLTQTFVNGHEQALEATYLFPLPDRAAVTRFRLEVAGRVIEGDLKERAAARQEYDRALQAGHRAAITEEERPGVFTLRVGNLPPGEEAVVRLTLVGPLSYSEGEATFRFPLVVAPRYIPGSPLPGPSVGDGTSPDTDAVPDASRISPPVLLPGFPNPVRLGLSVEVPLSGLSPSQFRSSLHTVIESEDSETTLFRLQAGERLDRDFILRFRIAQERVVTSLMLQPDRTGAEGTFLLTLVPPAESAGRWAPRDVAFVLDRSGSMDGWKIVAARRAMARMVETLTEADRFTVLAFDSAIETPPELGGTGLVPASDRMRFRAVEFLAKIDARGGTEMAEPLERAVAELTRDEPPRHVFPLPGERRERILVLVTDGQVGNEDQILQHLGRRLKDVRVFTLGIDRTVNAAFLKRLADLGGGRSEVVESEDRLDLVMDMVHRHIGSPVLTGLRLEPAWLRFAPDSLVPGRMPDLFAGTPLLISGRYTGEARGAIALQGRDASGQMWSAEVRAVRADGAALAVMWARGRLRELEDRYVIGAGDRGALEREIVATSLRFGVLCRFTAFVAVDRSEVVNEGGQVHGVVQSVEQPSGWGAQGAFGAVTRCGTLSAGATPAPPSRARKSMLARRFVREMPPASPPPGAGPAQNSMPSAPLPASSAPLVPDSDDDFDDDDDASQVLGDVAGEAAADRERTHRGDPIRASGPGLMRRLLSLFGRKPSKRAEQPPSIDRTPYRQRALELLQGLQGTTAPDAAARLATFRSLAAKLEELFKDLVAAGDRDPAVRRLGEVVLLLQTLLSQSQPQEADVVAVWTEVEKALQSWLALGETTQSPRREGFWK